MPLVLNTQLIHALPYQELLSKLRALDEAELKKAKAKAAADAVKAAAETEEAAA